MTFALIETDGMGFPVGAWLAEADQGAPDVAFADELDQLNAEMMLGQALEAMGDEVDWPAFLAHLFDRQNHITVLRFQVDWDGTVAELLAAALGAYRDGRPLLDV